MTRSLSPIFASTALLVLFVFGFATNANAELITQSENFSGGAVPAGYTFSVSGGHVTNDPDFSDGVSDGAIFVDGNNGGSPTSTVTFNFAGAIVAGEQYEFTTNLFQSSSSFAQTDIELLVDGVSVASIDPGNVSNALPRTAVLNYTALAGDAGKTLSFSASSKRAAGGGSSDLGIDNWNLDVAAVPEPSGIALLMLGGTGLAWIRRRRKLSGQPSSQE